MIQQAEFGDGDQSEVRAVTNALATSITTVPRNNFSV